MQRRANDRIDRCGKAPGDFEDIVYGSAILREP
jgi:hypothetical protein